MRRAITPILAFVVLGGSAAIAPLTTCLDRFGHPNVVDACTNALSEFPANYAAASLDHANVYASRAMAWREMGEREKAERDIAEAQRH
ncbi:MAG: hypothetical protein ACPGSI_12450, partial [Pikeienuella sp.]